MDNVISGIKEKIMARYKPRYFLPVMFSSETELLRPITAADGSYAWQPSIMDSYKRAADAAEKDGLKPGSAEFYALPAKKYMSNKLLYNHYFSRDTKISTIGVLMSDIPEITIFEKGDMGAFMPINVLIDKLAEVVEEKGPSVLVDALGKLKAITSAEVASCFSCGIGVHVPHSKEMSQEERVALLELIQEEKCYCIPCSCGMLEATARTLERTRHLNIGHMIKALKRFDATQASCNFEALQVCMQTLMGELGVTKMLACVKGQHQTAVVGNKSKHLQGPDLPAWLN